MTTMEGRLNGSTTFNGSNIVIGGVSAATTTTTTAASSSSVAGGEASRLDRIEWMVNESDVFLSSEYLLNTMLPGIVLTVLLLSVSYVAAFYSFDYVRKNILHVESNDGVDQAKEKKKSEDDEEGEKGPGGKVLLRQRRKFAYQVTNLVANTALSVAGVYFYVLCRHEYYMPEFATLSSSSLTSLLRDGDDGNIPVEHMVQGYLHYYPLACLQAGYQIWSLIVGTTYVKETPVMLAHHVSALIACVMTCALTNGFRYWMPYFFGMIELSSIPLSIMNAFKENPDLARRYPTVNLCNRLLFAFSFLFLRVALYAPKQLRYLTDVYYICMKSNSLPYTLIFSFVGIASWLLLGLQLYWGYLIALGLYKLFFGSSSSAVTAQKNKVVDVKEKDD